VRLFFALWPDCRTRVRIARAAAGLPAELGARRIPPENYHLTLAFVGEVAATQLKELQQVGSSQKVPGCTLAFDAYEYWRPPRVVVAAARRIPPELLELWTQLHRALTQSQAAPRFERAPAMLRAHVTLARKVAQAPVLQAMSPFEWTLREFSLIRSDTSGVHSVYTVVDTWPLLDDTPAR
jgi:RNA 2',3'-cyclic 3'-phosphodiesterase